MDGWMDGCVDGAWVDGWMDGQKRGGREGICQAGCVCDIGCSSGSLGSGPTDERDCRIGLCLVKIRRLCLPTSLWTCRRRYPTNWRHSMCVLCCVRLIGTGLAAPSARTPRVCLPTWVLTLQPWNWTHLALMARLSGLSWQR